MDYKTLARNAVILAASVALPTICEPSGGCASYKAGIKELSLYSTQERTAESSPKFTIEEKLR